MNFDESRESRGRDSNAVLILTLFYHFNPLHKHLDISRVITAGSSPLHIARDWTGTDCSWISLITKLRYTHDDNEVK